MVVVIFQQLQRTPVLVMVMGWLLEQGYPCRIWSLCNFTPLEFTDLAALLLRVLEAKVDI